MTEKRYKSIGTNLECSNGTEYMLIKRNDGVNVCQVCNEYTAKEIVDELNSLADENEQLKQQVQNIHKLINSKIQSARELGNLKTVIALKNLQRELKGDME